MNPFVRFLYMIGLMLMIAGHGNANERYDAGIALICAAMAFLWDCADYYLKREGRE